MAITFEEEKQNKQIAMLRRKEEEEAVQRLSKRTNIPYADLTAMNIETDALALVPQKTAEKIELACFRLVGKDLYVAIRNPEKPGLRDELFRLQNDGYTVGVYLASRRSLQKAWNRYADVAITSRSRSSFLDISPAALENISQKISKNEDIRAMIEATQSSDSLKRITQLIEIILGSAIATGSSDVHIEPQEDDVTVRLRQDGVLQDVAGFDHNTYHKINSRVKILSRLKLTQEKQAQDGRFTIDYNDQEIEIRTSIVPGAYGESIVMRVLNPDIISIKMKALGIEPKLFEVLRREIHKPNGLILTTGPTGSGKTTSLYAFLKEIYTPEIKILTIEDPIEYHLDGITQTQVNKEKGYTFLSGLRGALRQDPDAIMVGEIRDAETAEIAVNASLTGHIVLSTLHTNNAAGAIPRMLDLGTNPKVLPSALSVSIAQRLLRKLVPECSEPYTPDEQTQKLIRRILKQAERNGKDLKAYGVSADQDIVLYRPKQNNTCSIGNGSGYKGRIGIFEAILLDEAIEKIITKNPSEREIRRLADKQGLLTMQEDGVLKALAGVTSLEEVQKVVDLTELLEEETPQNLVQKKSEPAPAEKPIQKEAEPQNTKESTASQNPFDTLPGFVIPNEPNPTPSLSQKSPILQEAMSPQQPQHNPDLEARMAKIESSLERVASLLEATAQHATTPKNTPAPSSSHLATVRKIRQAEREHQTDLQNLHADMEENQPTDDHSAQLADQVRDLEILLLLDKIKQLEAQQRQEPTSDITSQLRQTRKAIIDILRANPPQQPRSFSSRDGDLVRQEVSAIINNLFAIERRQIENSTESAADELAEAHRRIDEVLTSSSNE